jgi:hypothetical protein
MVATTGRPCHFLYTSQLHITQHTAVVAGAQASMTAGKDKHLPGAQLSVGYVVELGSSELLGSSCLIRWKPVQCNVVAISKSMQE